MMDGFFVGFVVFFLWWMMLMLRGCEEGLVGIGDWGLVVVMRKKGLLLI